MSTLYVHDYGTHDGLAQADFVLAVAAAVDGDTVVFNAGSTSWTTTATVTKGITVQGTTFVTGDHNSSITATDGTIIKDDQPTRDQPIIRVNLTNPAASFKFVGLTIRYGDTITTKQTNGIIEVWGTCHLFRMTQCHFDQPYGAQLQFKDDTWGVVDHCVWDVRALTSEMIYVQHKSYAPDGVTYTDDQGDGSWNDTALFGTNRQVFFEDNYFNSLGTTASNGIIDSEGGGRCVVRYNLFHNVSNSTTAHGTESSGRMRGARSRESYGNVYTFNVDMDLGQLRSGTTLAYNNTWTFGDAYSPVTPFVHCYRQIAPFKYWSVANGNVNWDVNDAHGIYASGTDNSATTGNQFLTDTGASWTTNQWVGYSVTNTDLFPVAGFPTFPYGSFITSNTATRINFNTDGGTVAPGGTFLHFDNGQHYAIYKLTTALDQIGRGMGDLITGLTPLNSTTGTVAWPNQVLEPSYQWNNVINGSNSYTFFTNAKAVPTISENRDYYNHNASFTGSVGVGVGTHAGRPASGLTAGVGYWETDTNTFFIASGATTWVQYYQPFVYPHPIVGTTLTFTGPGSVNFTGSGTATFG